MKTSRRGFLGMMGGAVAGGRKGVAQVADEISRRVVPFGTTTEDVVRQGLSPLAAAPIHIDAAQRLDVHGMRLVGHIPDFLRRRWRQAARDVSVLDPDLAAMHSMSVSVRLLIQRERAEKAIEEEFWQAGEAALSERAFQKAFGYIDWGYW